MILLRKLFAVAFFLPGVLVVARAQESIRLTEHWEFIRQDLGGVWEAVRSGAGGATGTSAEGQSLDGHREMRDIVLRAFHGAKGGPESVPVWQPVTLPHCVNARDAVDPDGNYYQGPAWYRTLLTVKNPYPGGRVLLHFEGAGQATDVYVYTTKVGSHVGGYDEWTVDITDAVAACERDSVCRRRFGGSVPVVVRTDNSRNLERIPSAMSDFAVYGGLYRYVNLVYVPAVSFAGVFADAVGGDSGRAASGRKPAWEGRVAVRALLYRPGEEKVAGFSLRLTDPGGKVVGEEEVKSGGGGDGKIGAGDTIGLGKLVVRAPRLWSPDHPVLYKLSVTVKDANGVACTFLTDIGFRSYSFVDHGPFLLNGSRLLLRGTHRHEDGAGVGAAMTEEEMRREMVLMREMGVNYVRLGHYQQSPVILHLCDSLGILVWEEIPWCRGGLGGATYQAQARRMLTNMISQHYNHPAVILWGLGNENDWPGDFPEFDKEKIRSFMKELNELAHRLDPGRKTSIRRCDFCRDIPDVYSPSIWAGWYRGIFTEYRASTEEEFKKTPHFVHMEWGGDSHARRHSENPDKALLAVRSGGGTDERTGDASLYGGAARVSKDGDWSETYICNLFDWHLKEQEKMPWLTGAAQWIFKDFSTPLRPDNPVPFVNQKGVVERDGTKKESYYVFQSYWTERLMAHIYGHSWPVRWGAEGEEKMVKVYSNAPEAELFVNGASLGLRRRNSEDFPAAGLRWKAVFRRGANSLLVVARRGKEVVRDSIGFEYQTEKWGKPAKMELMRIEGRGMPGVGGRLRQDESAGGGMPGVGGTSGVKVGSDGEMPGVGGDTALVRVRLLDADGVPCLDAANRVRWGLTGDGQLLDDLGTSTGSRVVQVFNGVSMIRVCLRGGRSVVSVASEGLPTVFLNLSTN